MKSTISRYALALLCATAMGAISQSAQAATWDIVGGITLPSGQFPGYGTAQSQDNVINFAPSDVVDPSPGSPQVWNTGGNLNAVAAGLYNVGWFYIGSESGDVNRFTSTSVAGYLENNANNNCCYSSPIIGPQLMGIDTGLSAALTPFSFHDNNTGANVNNGSNVLAGTQVSGFILSYASLVGGQLILQTTASDWVVIGYNDNGGNDDNHDDFIVAAQIVDTGHAPAFTPLPAALPLFGSVLGGGFLFGRLRKRRQTKAQFAAA